MKKCFCLLLCLALLLALSAPVLAADPVADAMRAYAGIAAQAAGYDYGYSEFDVESRSWQYALVDLADGNGIPTLLLRECVESYMLGYLDSVRVFRYDAASGSVLAPATTLEEGVAAAGGFRGSIAVCDGLLSTHQFSSGTGMGDLTLYRLENGALSGSVVWSGRIDELPEAYSFTEIDWRDLWDTAPFDAYMPTETPESVVVPSPQKLSVDGMRFDCEKYNIDGSNYFKLRDLAFLLMDTPAQFAVSYDAAANAVVIAPGLPYEPIGTELSAGADNSASAVPSPQTVRFLDMPVDTLSVYNIGGSNFFKLRDLGELLGFTVDYDAASNTAVVLSGGPIIAPAGAEQAAAFDALCAWVEENANYEFEGSMAYRETVSPGSGTAAAYCLAAENTGSAPTLLLYYIFDYGDGSFDRSWLYLTPDSRSYYASYDYFDIGNETTDPDFFGSSFLVPFTFSGGEPTDFNNLSGPLAGDAEAYGFGALATVGFADSLIWLNSLCAEVPALSALGGVSAFGFGPERLGISALAG